MEKIGEYHNILLCFNCGGYNHFQNARKNERVCFKCTGSHYTEDIDSEERRSINSTKKGRKSHDKI